MCCLKNEQETYEYLNGRLPSVGDTVTVKEGAKGEVQSVSVLRQTVKVIIDNGDEKELREYKVDELSFRPKRRKDVKLTEEELRELEGLEDEGSTESEERTESPKEHHRRENRERQQDGEGNHYKKRYDGKKRHFNKNKKKRDQSSGE